MEILKNNYEYKKQKIKNQNTVFDVVCDNCGSELRVEEKDTHIGCFGAAYITCPCCKEESFVEEIKGITLTKDNFKFPLHFLRTNKDMRNVKEVSFSEIENEIKKGIDYLRSSNEENDYWYISYGNLFVVIFKYAGDEEYFILVTQDFYETYIPFEEEDYE